MPLLKHLLQRLLGALYRIRLLGLEHAPSLKGKALIVANHTSYLDALLLGVYLPGDPLFVINTQVARRWWIRPLGKLVRLLEMDPANPMSIKTLIRHLREGERVVIFPEGRITRTGSLMKIYDGAAMAADKAGAPLVPVRLDGPQYTPFSYLRGRYRLRWFPRVTLTLLPAVTIGEGIATRGRGRRKELGLRLAELMSQMVFATSDYRKTLFRGLLDAKRQHGGGRRVIEDIKRQPLSYNGLLTRAYLLGRPLSEMTLPGEMVGVLLPSSVAAASLFFGLIAYGRVPAMLNFTLGSKALGSTCATAAIRHVLTSRRFVEAAGLKDTLAGLDGDIRLHYLEDLAAGFSPWDKLRAWLLARINYQPVPRLDPDAPAVVLFTSGSEGEPKGVVLSHANLMANQAQMAARVDFGPTDVVCNALPMFHSFGLTAATLLPLLNGLFCFLYPSPLHYKVVPEIAYDINATILFGTNTFLTGYARHAHPYDFYSLRYLFAGAERVTQETRQLWIGKFGKRVLEGYGATETSPVIAVNSAMAAKEGSVGLFMPGMDWRLEPVPGVERGGRLFVRGPNIMLGYLLPGDQARITPPTEGWYDTGDIVEVDAEGFVTILGRAKRFAKIAGEMVSLGLVEQLTGSLWPEAEHAVVSLPDERKGEQLVLFTTQADAQRGALAGHVRAQGVSELHVPRQISVLPRIPVLGTGKTDYPALRGLADQLVAKAEVV